MKTTIITASAIALVAGLAIWVVSQGPDGSSEPKQAEVATKHEGPDTQQPAPKPTGWIPTERDLQKGTAPEITGELHPAVIGLVEPSMSITERRKALRLLPASLDPVDSKAIFDFINSEHPDLRQPAGHALVDAILGELSVRESFPEGFSQALVRMHFYSKDTVLQSYALQYLCGLYMHRDGHHVYESNHDARELILKTLIRAASQTKKVYSATALIALHRITEDPLLKQEAVTQAQLQAHAKDMNASFLKAATDQENHTRSRITAIQICAMRGQEEVLSVARELATNPKTEPSLRISAIAAIGQLGSIEEDAALLKQLEGQGVRFAHAARPALERLAASQN